MNVKILLPSALGREADKVSYGTIVEERQPVGGPSSAFAGDCISDQLWGCFVPLRGLARWHQPATALHVYSGPAA